jgi:glutamate dehydrogenase/leucine dehydrogenase
VEQLHELGAKLVVTDIDPEKIEAMVARYGVEKVDPETIYDVECDIFCPCALGAVIRDETLNRLRCKAICGSANNQLKEERHGDLLEQKGMVYAPDYIANAGGPSMIPIDCVSVASATNEARKRCPASIRIWSGSSILLTVKGSRLT